MCIPFGSRQLQGLFDSTSGAGASGRLPLTALSWVRTRSDSNWSPCRQLDRVLLTDFLYVVLGLARAYLWSSIAICPSAPELQRLDRGTSSALEFAQI